jgi:hypothetical protein
MYLEALASIAKNFHNTQTPLFFIFCARISEGALFDPFCRQTSITIACQNCELHNFPHYVSHDHLIIMQAIV